jgi:hypothetical protein
MDQVILESARLTVPSRGSRRPAFYLVGSFSDGPPCSWGGGHCTSGTASLAPGLFLAFHEFPGVLLPYGLPTLLQAFLFVSQRMRFRQDKRFQIFKFLEKFIEAILKITSLNLVLF